MGMATLMILFHKAEVLPFRCMNPGKGLFQRHVRTSVCDFVSVFITQKKNTDTEEEAEKRQRGESVVLYVPAAVFSHTL